MRTFERPKESGHRAQCPQGSLGFGEAETSNLDTLKKKGGDYSEAHSRTLAGGWKSFVAQGTGSARVFL